MESFRSGCVEFFWDAESRLSTVKYHGGPKPSGEDGRQIVAAVRRWIGTEPMPFGMLVNGANLVGGEPEYRSIMGGFYRENKERVSIALFNLKPVFRIATEMFSLGAGIRMKTFGSEAEARAWLRKAGIAA
jgi:hypothetical protein